MKNILEVIKQKEELLARTQAELKALYTAMPLLHEPITTSGMVQTVQPLPDVQITNNESSLSKSATAAAPLDILRSRWP